ncbi:hypothetical protein Prudu_815S000100 [Prunus dulcis]|uniref:Uncharacterized protein n=1 Tax=Prunus dulcis TaxID=3755 RepID=A0A5H2Y4D6_PRUDU|nr:hypothetical protein Prudu_815S000100 [Prunus dulcis]
MERVTQNSACKDGESMAGKDQILEAEFNILNRTMPPSGLKPQASLLLQTTISPLLSLLPSLCLQSKPNSLKAMDQHKTDDNLHYIGGLTRVLAVNASISFAGAAASSSSLRLPLKKLFFEERIR